MSPAPDHVEIMTERDGPKAFELRGIAQTFWRHKLITIAGIVLTLVVTGALVATSKPTYEARDTVLLKPPLRLPAESSDTEEGSTDNPFLRFGSLELASNALKNVMENKATMLALEDEGLDGEYEVVIVPTGSGAIIDLVVESDTEAKAQVGGDVLLEQLEEQLLELQGDVSEDQLITVAALTQPDEATPLYSSRMRVGVVTVLLGLLLTATATAIAESRRIRKIAEGADGASEPPASDPTGEEVAPAAPAPPATAPPAVEWQPGDGDPIDAEPDLAPATAGTGTDPAVTTRARTEPVVGERADADAASSPSSNGSSGANGSSAGEERDAESRADESADTH